MLPLLDTQTCSRCGKGSPSDAVLCWACYTPLGNAGLTSLQIDDNEAKRRFPRPAWWRDHPELVGSYTLAGALISSGWWRGKTRFAVTGVCAITVAILVMLEKRDRAVRKQRESGCSDLGDGISRIVDQILLLAIKDKASQVRLTCGEGDVEGQYLIDQEWQGTIRIPRESHAALQYDFLARSTKGRVQLSTSGQRIGAIEFALSGDEIEAAFSLRVLIEPARAEIFLTPI